MSPQDFKSAQNRGLTGPAFKRCRFVSRDGDPENLPPQPGGLYGI